MEATMRSLTKGVVRRTVTALALAVALLLTLAASAEPGGNVFCNGIRTQDEIVLVNTRMLCGSCDPEALRTGLGFETYANCDEAGGRHWQPSDLESFVSFDPSVRTIIFIHGNRITPYAAKNEGLAVYRKLANYAGDGERFRFVIWSWPSGQIPGP